MLAVRYGDSFESCAGLLSPLALPRPSPIMGLRSKSDATDTLFLLASPLLGSEPQRAWATMGLVYASNLKAPLLRTGVGEGTSSQATPASPSRPRREAPRTSSRLSPARTCPGRHPTQTGRAP